MFLKCGINITPNVATSQQQNIIVAPPIDSPSRASSVKINRSRTSFPANGRPAMAAYATFLSKIELLPQRAYMGEYGFAWPWRKEGNGMP